MTTQPDDALISAQHEVQRLLGSCLLRLQAYERGVKVLRKRRPDPTFLLSP